jgi:hypothetical protein
MVSELLSLLRKVPLPCCPAANAISQHFEVKFARLEYVGDGRFNMAFLRHTGQWFEFLSETSLDECLEEIKINPLLQS